MAHLNKDENPFPPGRYDFGFPLKGAKMTPNNARAAVAIAGKKPVSAEDCRKAGIHEFVLDAFHGDASGLDRMVRDLATRMTDTESYWIGKISSECGEYVQAAGNATCFGIDTPDNGGSGRERMEDEIGDIHAAVTLAIQSGILSKDRILARSEKKRAKLLDPKQRDNLGRRLAPPVPPEQQKPEKEKPADMLPRAEPMPHGNGDTRILLTADVVAALERHKGPALPTLDAVMRRLLQIPETPLIPQDGAVGYRDLKTGFTFPEGFAIERTRDGITYTAIAQGGQWVTPDGAAYSTLNHLNASLKIGRPENAWTEWRYRNASGKKVRLGAVRPIGKLRASRVHGKKT